MKIMIIIPTLGRGGAEKLATQLAIEQKKSGMDILVVSYYTDYSDYNYLELKENDVNVVFLNKRKGMDIKIFKSIKNVIKSYNPDVINTHLDVLLYMLPIHFKNKVYHTVHSMSYYEANGFQKLIRIVAFKIKKFIPIAIGTSIQESICTYYKINKNKVPVIYNGTNYTIHTINRKYDDILNLCIVGSLIPVKNHKLLIEALKKCFDDGHFFNLYIIGEGYLKNELIEMINNYDLNDYVRFTGYTINVSDYLKKSDIYICSSKVEGISIAIIEAMFYGLPILATNVGGNLDIVKDKFNGYIFDENADALADLLKKIDLNRNELLKISYNSYLESQNYTIKNCSDNYLKLYNNQK